MSEQHDTVEQAAVNTVQPSLESRLSEVEAAIEKFEPIVAQVAALVDSHSSVLQVLGNLFTKVTGKTL